MLVVGILIIIIATLMILFPEFFMKLKSPRIPEKLFKSPILRELIDLNIIERIIVLSKTEKGKVEECFENTKEGYKKYVRN